MTRNIALYFEANLLERQEETRDVDSPISDKMLLDDIIGNWYRTVESEVNDETSGDSNEDPTELSEEEYEEEGEIQAKDLAAYRELIIKSPEFEFRT